MTRVTIKSLQEEICKNCGEEMPCSNCYEYPPHDKSNN